MAVNIFAQGMDAFDQSWDRTQGFHDKATARKAGRALAGGDRAGAMQAYGNAGQVDAVRTLQRDQVQAEDRASAQALQQRQQQQAEGAKRAEILMGAAGALKQLPLQQRRQALSHPIFQAAGLPPEELAKLTDDDLSDTALDMFVGEVKKQLEFVKGSDGTWAALDKETGREVASGMTPKRESYMQVDPEKDLVRIPGQEPGPAAPTSAGISGPLAELESAGVRVTSTTRTPERNKAVNGVPTSRHMSGEAVDLVPPPGMTMAQLAQESRRKFPNARVINEGDHVHVQWGRGGSAQPAAPQTVRPGQRKPGGRMASPEEKARLGLPADGAYWLDADGKPTPVGGEKPNKPLTEYQGKSVEYLNAALSGNDRLNELARSRIYKPATPTDSLFSREKDGTARLILRNDQDRAFVQAAKEFLAPILRKDTGAAVTDSELATYMDIYIPKYEDPPRVMWQKAQARDAKMRALYGANRQAYDQTFGAPGKWQVLTDPRASPSSRAAGGNTTRGAKDRNSVTVDGVTMTVRPK